MTVPTRRLGRSNREVSALGLGGWAIGGAMAAGDQPLGDAGVDDGAGRFHPLRLGADEAHASRTGTAISSDRFC